MVKETKQQKNRIGRVMHEFKQGELETSHGAKVTDPKQAVAIGLSEAGASKFETPNKSRENLRRTKAKEARGETAQAESEGRGETRANLYEEARRCDIKGRSAMSKAELQRAVRR